MAITPAVGSNRLRPAAAVLGRIGSHHREIRLMITVFCAGFLAPPVVAVIAIALAEIP